MKKFTWISHQPGVAIALMAGLLLGCASTIPTPETMRTPLSSNACPDWRWIGLRPEGAAACPSPPGTQWKVSPLFADAPADPLLRRFCLYQHSQAGNGVDIPTLVLRGSLAQAERDCMGVALAGNDDLGAMTWDDLAHHFMAQTGAVPLMVDGPPRVRLAFLDTQPTRDELPAKPGNSPHGYSMAHLARALACAQGAKADPKEEPNHSCAARITTQLALPMVSFDPQDAAQSLTDTVSGGFFGSFSDLALAIRRELASWKKSGEQHLVLNLSLAWDGRFGGLENRVCAMPVPVQAAYRALESAANQGALIVAATGNRKGGPEPEKGPLLPAAWEYLTPNPDPQACSKGAASGDRVNPILYAAAGVGSDGSPLANARLLATPPRVAYADHAVAQGALNYSPTATYTGTSVATSVISTVAAVIWHYRPDLSVSALMETLEQSGDKLDRLVEVYAGQGTPPQVRRISLCPALIMACEGGQLCSTALPACDPWNPNPPNLTSALDEFVAQDQRDVAALTASMTVAPPCRAQDFHYDPSQGVPGNPCPGDQFFGIQADAWLHPQPENIPCPNCTIRRRAPDAYELSIKIEETWTGGTLTDPTLDIGSTSFALRGDLRPGDSVAVRQIPATVMQGASVPIVLNFKLQENDTSVQNPVLFAQ